MLISSLCVELLLPFYFRRPHIMYVVRKSLLHSPKIQALFIWKHDPAAKPLLLTLLSSLKVVASVGVDIDHLDVPSTVSE